MHDRFVRKIPQKQSSCETGIIGLYQQNVLLNKKLDYEPCLNFAKKQSKNLSQPTKQQPVKDLFFQTSPAIIDCSSESIVAIIDLNVCFYKNGNRLYSYQDSANLGMWNQQQQHLFVYARKNSVKVLDIQKKKPVGTFYIESEYGRVSGIDFIGNRIMMASSYEGIYQFDLRTPKETYLYMYPKIQEMCTLKLNSSLNNNLALNDYQNVGIWEMRKGKILMKEKIGCFVSSITWDPNDQSRLLISYGKHRQGCITDWNIKNPLPSTSLFSRNKSIRSVSFIDNAQKIVVDYILQNLHLECQVLDTSMNPEMVINSLDKIHSNITYDQQKNALLTCLHKVHSGHLNYWFLGQRERSQIEPEFYRL